MIQQCDIILSLFHKPINECKNEIEYWLYFMKNANKITKKDLDVIKK